MEIQDKTKEEVLKDLYKLRKEYDSMKVSCEMSAIQSVNY